MPDYVAELETHRHKGIDIFLLTQHPRLIDTNVRALVGHHCHIAKTNLGVRRIIEWERCGDPTLTRDVQSAVKSVYTLDKNAFGVYKSAEEHTKIRTKLSRVVYAFPVLLAALIAACFYIYSSWNKRVDDVEQQKPQIEAQASIPAAGGAVAAPAANGTDAAGQYPPKSEQAGSVREPPKPHLSEDDYKPAIDGQPWTAPIYNSQNKAIRTMPFPVACVKNQNKCTCYTEQATPIKDIAKEQCLDYVANGIYNPYKQTVQNQAQTVETSAAPTGQVAVLGGKSPMNLMYDGYNEKTLSNEGAKVGI